MRSLILWVILLIVGFLLGFVRQYTRARHLEQQVNICNAGLELAQVRQSAALMYVEATQLNYGNAGSYAQHFFDQAQKLAGTTSDATVRNKLAEIVSSRDRVTAELAKGNSAVITELQPILLKIEQGF